MTGDEMVTLCGGACDDGDADGNDKDNGIVIVTLMKMPLKVWGTFCNTKHNVHRFITLNLHLTYTV